MSRNISPVKRAVKNVTVVKNNPVVFFVPQAQYVGGRIPG
jgi:hypothetical protein